jgi:hypothetical protein
MNITPNKVVQQNILGPMYDYSIITQICKLDLWNFIDTVDCQVSSSPNQNLERATRRLLHDKTYLKSYLSCDCLLK